MLTLRPDQLERLQALVAERQAAVLQQALAAAWPAVASQLGDRWPAFVGAALAHGRTLGWLTAGEGAAYAGLCCVWGAGFIGRPGFEAAAAIVGDTRRPPALRLHQLLQLSRGVLRAQPGPVSAEAFDAAASQVAAALAQAARVHAVFADEAPPPPPQACDLDELAFEVVEARPWREYRRGADGWAHVPRAALARAPQVWREAPDAPAVWALTSHAPGAGPAAQARLLLSAPQHCDEHPLLTHHAAGGRRQWRGAEAARVALPLHAPADEPGGGIASPGTAEVQRLTVQTCGVRDAGAPFGTPALELHVHPATQWLLQLQHDGAASTLRLEADGEARDAAAWQAAWRELPARCRAGLEKLLNAWACEALPGSERLSGRCDALAGSAALTWGWRSSAPGAVAMRVDGETAFTALDLDLALDGRIAFAGGTARLRLQVQGREDWRGPLGGEGALADAQCRWRHPVRVTLEPEVTDGPLIALATPVPLSGALTGRCGLRPRPDGRGWQWHFALELEPVTVRLAATDPLLGEQRVQRTLLPALTLVDWSAG